MVVACCGEADIDVDVEVEVEVEVEVVTTCSSSAGTETRAEVLLRMVRLRMCHSMPEGREGKLRGRVER